MSVQIGYSQQPDLQLGVINGVAPHTIVSGIAENADILFGAPVDRGTDPAKQVVTSAIASSGALFGIAISQASVEAEYPYNASTGGNVSWKVGQAVGVIRDGVIAVEVPTGTVAAETIVPGAAAEVDSGAFIGTGGSALTNVTWESLPVVCSSQGGEKSRELVLVRIWPSV